jgi:hypothetical protein
MFWFWQSIIFDFGQEPQWWELSLALPSFYELKLVHFLEAADSYAH